MPQLFGIYLNSNLIEQLPKYAFDKSSVQEIDLRNNLLKEFDPNSFPASLQKLCLSGNEINRHYEPKLLELLKQHKPNLEVDLPR